MMTPSPFSKCSDCGEICEGGLIADKLESLLCLRCAHERGIEAGDDIEEEL